MTEEEPGAFVIVAEWPNQGPIVLETEGEFSSRDAALERTHEMAGSLRWTRWCVCRLTFETGNPLALADLERMQK